MAFPEDLNRVSCNGFPRKLLTKMVQGIENGTIKVRNAGISGGSGCGAFAFNGKKYMLYEEFEMVDEITLD